MDHIVLYALIGFVVSGGAAALPHLLAHLWEWATRDRRPLRSDGYTQDGHPTIVSLMKRLDERLMKP
jgi:hypothetical protein